MVWPLAAASEMAPARDVFQAAEAAVAPDTTVTFAD